MHGPPPDPTSDRGPLAACASLPGGARWRSLSGWGRFPVERCVELRPRTPAETVRIVRAAPSGGVIARGLGRSYGDAALNQRGVVVDLTGHDRFLELDEERGILRAEAGVSLADVVRHLLPRGWFLPVTPGTKFVTLGGALAADVHGKNHHAEGSLSASVLDLELLTASGEVLVCSARENPDVFWATLGGMGLTGIVLSARLRLLPVRTAFVRCTDVPCRDLDVLLERLEATERGHRYSVAWIDGLARGANLGRGVLMIANDAPPEDLPRDLRERPLEPRPRRQRSAPPLPSGALNRLTVSAFNALYRAGHRGGARIVDYESFFYPLDALLRWNRIYGGRGFVQYQAVLPSSSSRAGLVELLRTVADAGASSFLAVLKRSGPSSPGPLSFLVPGHTLALDIPNRGVPTRELAERLDRILLRHGGRVYLAKDALASASSIREMYPGLPGFRKVKALVDPGGLFVSSQARRLGIVDT